MIKVFNYKRGKVKKIDLKRVNFLREVCWVDINDPDEKDLKSISNKTGVSILDLKSALDKREVPRIFNRRTYSGFIFRAPNKNGTIPCGVYIGKRFVLTLRKGSIKSINQFANTIEKSDAKLIFERGLESLVYHLVSTVMKEYSTLFDQMEDKLEKIENKIIKSSSEESMHSVFALKRNLLFFRRSLVGNKEVISKIEQNQLKFVQQKDTTLFSNLHVETSQLVNVAELYRERITGISEMYVSNISNKLNDIMKSFSVIAALLLLPTLLSGIWGMNFARIPWYNHPWGFYFPIALMIASMILLFMFFKAKKWV